MLFFNIIYFQAQIPSSKENKLKRLVPTLRVLVRFNHPKSVWMFFDRSCKKKIKIFSTRFIQTAVSRCNHNIHSKWKTVYKGLLFKTRSEGRVVRSGGSSFWSFGLTIDLVGGESGWRNLTVVNLKTRHRLLLI